jgi:hypothetical protein
VGEGHHKKVVRHNKVAYGIFYFFRKVYASDLHVHVESSNGGVEPSVEDDPEFFKMNPSNQGVYEGSLIQAGGSFWVVINNTRWAFPDYDTFLAMGMDQCRGCVVKGKEALSLPIGPTFSTKSVEFWPQLNQIMPQTVPKELELQGYVSVPSNHLPSMEEFHKRLLMLYEKYGGMTIDSADMLSIMEPIV